MVNNLINEQLMPSAQLRGIKFGLMTEDEIEIFSNATVNDASDLTSGKLGLPNASSQCTTCGSTNTRDCEGHIGHIKLPTPIYHPHLVREVVNILNRICPACKTIKKENIKDSRRKRRMSNFRWFFLNIKLGKLKLSHKIQSVLARLAINHVKLMKLSRGNKKTAIVESQAGCKHCSRNGDDWYPTIKFRMLLRDAKGNKCVSIAAEFNEKLPSKFINKSPSEVLPSDFWNFLHAVRGQQVVSDSKSMDTNRIYLSPAQAFYLLRDLNQGFIEKFVPRRDLIFLSCIPVSPNCQRLVETSHIFSNGPRVTFDKRTKAYRGVVDTTRRIDEFQKLSADAALYVASRVQECLNVSKLHSNNNPAEEHAASTGLKWVKEAVLSKRTDHTFRMTMIGDPKIHMGEIGLPLDLAEMLYIAEHVNARNVEKLRLTCNIHLLSVEELIARREGKITKLRRSNQLQVGDIFHRPLENGDVILINRPPSVHPHSLLAPSVKMLPIKSVVSVNPLCCAPLLGDFDGDCLHGYIPQSIQARVELNELLSLEQQLYNFQDGKSLLSFTHDSLTAAHLLMEEEVLLNKFEVQQLEMFCAFKSQDPAIIEAPLCQKLQWTGQQLFSMLLPGDMDCVAISKDDIAGIFSTMLKSYGRTALNYLFGVQDLLCEYITARGFSVSLSDLYLTLDRYTRNKLIAEVSCGLEEAKVSCYFNELLHDPEMVLRLKEHDEADDFSHTLNLSNSSQGRRPISQASVAQFRNFFRELQSVIHHYIVPENSLLKMVHAGSKGSLVKLIQQGVCLGMQLSAKPLPFSIPQELSCPAWNRHKEMDISVDRKDVLDYARDEFSYAVVEASFLDGLSPLECFVHAASSRANMFSDNAQVPGTLTRRLMFHIRDLYVAYDGTVRNSYGQQVVQFSYGSTEEASCTDQEYDKFSFDEDSGGKPVGSLAACSISEAAYGALDTPVNSLEASPLLNIKNVLECAPSRASVDRTASLFLSRKLKRLNYGSEYGALSVRNHLDKVFFSDLVTSVSIFYGTRKVGGTKGVKLSPWICHFHVDKEKVMRKRTNVKSIINVLSGDYESFRERTALPRLLMTSQDCDSDNEQKEREECCISVAVEDSNSLTLLDSIRDYVIPALLGTLIKGFMEFKQVDILWDTYPEPEGQLFLKISMSEDCRPGKFWQTLLDACVPIMDLIDWERSRPDGIHDISDAFGIDSARNYFQGSLKSAVTDIGRNIHQEHVLLVSDTLSVTGEFHGLTAKGLKKQRAQLSISTPFTQACFSNPEKCFIEAGRQSSVDHLYGTVDAVSWGKEAPVGTGGPFSLAYSGKVHNERQTENVYEALISHKQDKFNRNPSEIIVDKWRRPVVGNTKDSIKRWDDCDCTTKKSTDVGFDAKFASTSIGSWDNIMDMNSSLREILHQYSFGEHLNEEHKSLLLEALTYHPKKDAKIGNGIKEIKIGHSQMQHRSRCFILIRNDGTTEDFSYRKCVVGAANEKSPEFGSFVEKKLYRR